LSNARKSRVSGRTLWQVSDQVTVVIFGTGFGPSPAPTAVFWGIYLWSGLSAGIHLHGVLGTCPDPPAWDRAVGTLVRTAPSIAQVTAGPPEALIMGALLTSQVLDIAIGVKTSGGMEGRRA
ncbi:hypothetical protein LSAT2_029493, partial [Lamellibrachia satsuma]